jgi:aryl-alcohol dehydrogenase-like predicted oxidoreductase
MAAIAARPTEDAMEKRIFGRTEHKVAVLGFGCGAVGGLMTKGAYADQERAVARALEAGVNYFDTAPIYGNGESEKNLGKVLRALKPDVVVGTKVRLDPADVGKLGTRIAQAMDESLARLGRDHVDLYQLHNMITSSPGAGALTADVVLNEVVPAFDKLKAAGKTKFLGITALGDAAALHRVIDSGRFDTAQIAYNILSPSAARALPPGFPGHDYGRLFDHTEMQNMGTIGIRVLAAGALSGDASRHPLAMQDVAPIGSAPEFATDVARARKLQPIIAEGQAGSLVEAALRYAISTKAMKTVLIGYSNMEHLEAAIAAAEKGPLPAAVLQRIEAIQNAFAGA